MAVTQTTLIQKMGIDESNHGRAPEFYVGFVSSDPADWILGDHGKRKKKQFSVDALKDATGFRYVVLEQHEISPYGVHGAKAIAIAQLILDRPSIEEVVVDGNAHNDLHAKVLLALGNHPAPNLRWEAKADRKYRGVNQADWIARILYRHHNDTGKFWQTGKIDIGGFSQYAPLAALYANEVARGETNRARFAHRAGD